MTITASVIIVWLLIGLAVYFLYAKRHSNLERPAMGRGAELKAGDFADAWGGIASLQLGLAAVWTAAGPRDVPLPEVVATRSLMVSLPKDLADEVEQWAGANEVSLDVQVERLIERALGRKPRI